MAAKRAPKQPAHERKRTILDGARSVFAASSYAQAETADLAKAAGVKPAALYRYFPSKRDLYLATLRDAGPRLLELWRQAIDQAEDPLAAIWTLGMAYYDHVESHSAVMRLWFQALGETADPEVRETVAATVGGAVDLLVKNIEDGKARGLIREDVEPRLAAWHFMAIGFSFDIIHLLGFDADLGRARAEEWGRLYIDSLRERPDGTAEGEPRSTKGATK